MSDILKGKIEDLKKAIAVQECMRDALGSDVVEVTISILHQQIIELEAQLTPSSASQLKTEVQKC